MSWRSQLFSLAVHGILILAILLTPWPSDDWMIWLVLLIIVVSQAIRSQRRISARHGEISLLQQDRLLWRKQEWKIKQPVWMIDSGILLTLRREPAPGGWLQAIRGRKHKLWLACDSMSEDEWRRIRQILLTGKHDAPPVKNHHPL